MSYQIISLTDSFPAEGRQCIIYAGAGKWLNCRKSTPVVQWSIL